MLFSSMVDALGEIRLGKSFRGVWPACVTCSLIEEWVAHRKTPMLDLVPSELREQGVRYT